MSDLRPEQTLGFGELGEFRLSGEASRNGFEKTAPCFGSVCCAGEPGE